MALSNDKARCHDDHCPPREQCQRWLQRETGRVHVASLRFRNGCELFDYLGLPADEDGE
jgi:hypothetical protein